MHSSLQDREKTFLTLDLADPALLLEGFFLTVLNPELDPDP